MKPRGEDTAAAVREWIKDDIKKAPSSQYELGRFFFGVSTASLGILVGFKKPDHLQTLDCLVLVSLLFIFASTIIALLMVIPRKLSLSSDVDLFEQYQKQVRGLALFIWIWFFTWMAGVVTGIYAVLIK